MKLLLVPLLLTGIALAANPQDEQVVRTAYAKLAYAVQSQTVFDAAQKAPDITSPELVKKLQDNELSFTIVDMSSGALQDIASRPYSDFVTKPDRAQPNLIITHNTQHIDENGKHITSYLAIPHWTPHWSESQENWDMPMKDALVYAGIEGRYSRYVTATITVRFQQQSRTYHTLWLFSDSDLMAIDTVSGNSIVRTFAMESAYPSVLTDTTMRSHPAVDQWLNSTQRFDASCKAGKQDVCCDSGLRCGVSSEDLRSTKPAPNTTATPKGGN